MLRGAGATKAATAGLAMAGTAGIGAARGGVRLPPQHVRVERCGPDLLHDLHAGLSGSLLSAIPTGLLYWWTFEVCSNQLHLRLGRPEPGAPAARAAHLLSSAAAAAVSSVARVPTDLMRQRVQAGLEPSLVAAARSAWRRGNGPRGLYGGWAATLIRDIPEMMLSFTLFELGRQQWLGRAGSGGSPRQRGGRDGGGETDAWRHMALGGGCGAVSAALTVPLDNIKARVQCGLGSNASGFAGVRQAAEAIILERGQAGLMAGLGPRVVQVRGAAR
jgi:solute carrier family 25 S-adenosylmethionine transporter 26